MHSIAYSQDSNTYVQLKQHSACFEQGFEKQPASPPADLAFVHLVARGPCSENQTATRANNPNPLRIDDYLLLDQVDLSGTQYKAIHTTTQEELVCKVVNQNELWKTLSAYIRLDGDEHINQVQKVVTGREKAYIFFPKSYGNLHWYVRTKRRLREAEAQQLFRQVVEAVAECHEKGIVLHDLKLRKFVFKDAERTQLKLESLDDAVICDDEDDTLSDKHGCPAYVSPEILTAANRCYSGYAADAWSLGVMLFTMLAGRYPFHGLEPATLFAKIRRGDIDVPAWLSSKSRCLIRALLRPNPEERLTPADVLAHPWLKPGSLDVPLKCEAKVPDQIVPSGSSVSLYGTMNIQSNK